MKIAIVASEMVPFAKTGGLADVAGTLPGELASLGHEVIAFVPLYKGISITKQKLQLEIEKLEIPLGTEVVETQVYSKTLEGVKFYLIHQAEFFQRDYLYGTAAGDYPDNDRRFTFFQRAVLEALRSLRFKPQIIHCHDWQTGLIPVYLKTLYAEDPQFKKTKSIFTLHNLAYQGNFPPDSLAATGFSWDLFHMDRLEFYGKVSFLKGGIVYADTVTTVSERYAQEIQTKEFGCGLEGILAKRGDKIYGIVNGIDYQEWNPETDKDIAEPFSAQAPEKKAASKKLLQEENGFAVDPKVPVVGIISRLIDQKGIDLLVSAFPAFMGLGIQFVLLGTGDEKYHSLFRQFAKRYPDHCRIHIVFDSKMAKRIYAGCDLLLIPSHYEPCGLAQMIAFRYGTIPIARETGGLADTVHEFDLDSGQGNGFVFKDYTREAFLNCVERAVGIFKIPKFWQKLVKNAMACDFSWKASAKQYIELYQMMGVKK